MGSERIVFAGTPEFACGSLEALLSYDRCSVVAVYTQPDRPSGRGKRLQASAVKQCALAHDVPVYQPRSLRDAQAQRELRALDPGLMIVAAYGLILPLEVLEIPHRGCINVHASILPRWRGAAPIERAIEAGDRETGITIMQMDVGLDTGDMLLVRRCAIAADDTGDTLRLRLAHLGAEALIEALEKLLNGELQPQPQDDQAASYATKLRREEATLNWTEDADMLQRRVRAFNSANPCQGLLDGQSVRIWAAQSISAEHQQAPGTIIATNAQGIQVACGRGVLVLTRLQLPGGRAMDAAAMLNGRPGLFHPGKLFNGL